MSVFELIRKGPSITILEMASRLAVVDKTIKRVVSYLMKRNLIKRIGPDKGGHWEISDRDK